MNPMPFSTCLRSIVVVILSVTLMPSTTVGQAEKATVIEKFADLLGGALKAATGRKVPNRPAPALRALAQPMMPAVPLNREDELIDRHERLEAYADVSGEWLSTLLELNDAQQRTLRVTHDQEVALSQADAKRRKVDNNDRSHRYFADYFVIKFTDTDGAARRLDFTRHAHKLQEVNLAEAQKRTLEELTAERKAFFESAALGQLMNLLDAELFFAPEQRVEFSDGLRSTVNLDVTGFAFTTSTYYFNQRIAGPLVQRGKFLNVLEDSQRRRLADITNAKNSSSSGRQYLLFSTSDGVDAWQEKLVTSIKEQRERLMRAIAVRVDFHRTQCNLSDETAHRLMVAGKGASDVVIAEWKRTSRTQLKGYEQQAAQWVGRGNMSFAVNLPNIQTLAANDIWTHSIESAVPEASDQLTERNRLRTQANAEFVVAMLDKELWLTQKQREHLIPVVFKMMPHPDKAMSSSSYYNELALLGMTMFKFPDQDLPILTDKQKRAWKAMKKPLQTNGNYILVQRRNGGQMHVGLPQ